jgi:hypothetical protein
MTSQMKECACPSCGIPLDAASGVSDADAQPETGDITVCFYCNTVLEYTGDMDLVAVDIMTLQPEVRDLVTMALLQIQMMRESRTLH